MRLSCNVHCLRDRPLRDALPAIREIGYEAVEVDWPRVQREFAATTGCAETLTAVLEESDLHLSSMFISAADAIDEIEIEPMLAGLTPQIAAASALGLPAVTVRAGDRRQQPFEMLTKSLRLLLDRASRTGIVLQVGNALGSALEQIEDFRQLFMEIDHPGLRLALDAGQSHCAAVNPRNVIGEFADRLNLIQLNDRIGRRIVSLGQGEMNVQAIIETARRSGYDGWLVIDAVLPNPREAPQYLADARAYLQALLSDAP